MGILFSSYAWLYIVYLNGNRSATVNQSLKFKFIETIFIFSLIWIPFISLLNMSFNEYFVSLQRFLITFPFIIFCYIYKGFDWQLTKKFLRLFTIFMTVAGLTIPIQIIFGPISFFAESGFRAELVRYASLAGSLTALGTLGGISLGILLFSEDFLFDRRVRTILIILTILCMLMSLQKAAVVNIIICWIFFFLFYGKNKLHKKVFSFIIYGLIFYLFYNFTKNTYFGSYIDSIISYTFSRNLTAVEADLINRLWEYPSRVIKFHNMNVFDYFLGIGFPALAGTLGNPQFPMAHNNYFDLVFASGILHFFSYLLLMLKIPIKVFKKKIKGREIDLIDRIFSISVFLILINMMIGATTFYQPVSTVITFYIVFSYGQLSKSIKKEAISSTNYDIKRGV
ncbi:MAG: hypothetical protein DDT40_00712 [candidate division WS2 bacterium]|nr:hypothetical protein [Candidatus Psychracetigena formicireducens]